MNNPAAAWRGRLWLYLPDRAGWRSEIGRGLMEFAQQPSYLDELVVAPQSRHRGAGQEREDVAIQTIDTQVAGRVSEALVLQVTQQRSGRVAGGPPGPADRVAHAPHPIG